MIWQILVWVIPYLLDILVKVPGRYKFIKKQIKITDMGIVKITDLIDWKKVTDNDEVIKLIKEREKIDEQIMALDEMALVRFELESLNV